MLALAAGGAMALTPLAAHADALFSLNSTMGGHVTVWHFTNPNSPGGKITDPSQQALPYPENPEVKLGNKVYGDDYTGPINFVEGSGGGNTIADFLESAGGTFSPPLANGVDGLDQTISSSPFAETTVIEISFHIPNYIGGTIDHDDGISIWNSNTGEKLVDASAPTTAELTSYALNPGSYNLWYVEANGLPPELVMKVPEPGSLALLGTALVGLGMVGWCCKKRRTA